MDKDFWVGCFVGVGCIAIALALVALQAEQPFEPAWVHAR